MERNRKMANFSFETQGFNTYLTYRTDVAEQLDHSGLGMITNNSIPGLASAFFTQLDSDRYIKYNVTSRVQANQFLSGVVNRARLVRFLTGIVDAMLLCDDYMLDSRCLLLDNEYIFVNVSTSDPLLIYLPVNGFSQNNDAKTFFMNLMYNIQFDQTEDSSYVVRIINYLNGTPAFSAVEFKSVLSGISNEAGTPVHAGAAGAGTNNGMTAGAAGIGAYGAQMSGGTTGQGNAASVYGSTVPGGQGFVPPQQPNIPSSPDNSGAGIPGNPSVPAHGQEIPQVSVPPVRPTPPEGGKTGGGQMQIPPSGNVPFASVETAPDDNEQKMSLFYLLQHYNSDNAALYKAQKEKKKAAGHQASQNIPVNNVPAGKTQKKKKGHSGSATPGFSVPGQESAPAQGFAVSGQPGNQSVAFNVPGQEPVRPIQTVQPAQPVQPARPQVDPVQHNQPGSTVPPRSSSGGAPYTPPVKTYNVGPNMNFGETTVLGGGIIGETTVLDSSSLGTAANPVLVREKNGERITIDKPVFRIGKEKSYVDYFIGDNTAISRSHANIVSRDGAYYIVDTNSTNHTYVNDGMIQSGSETPITDGTRIKLANENFVFRLI